ncbi:hypothetical protein [Georgenia faecalis]|uniref:hypothetical protein n=1 Tax=Georgenia faecalis TaxID=2483799 RepID=UPI000FD8FC7F|nr:hypothetical protein [Georgenia faecalis]
MTIDPGVRSGRYRPEDVDVAPLPRARGLIAAGVVALVLGAVFVVAAGGTWWTWSAWPLLLAGSLLLTFAGRVRRQAARRVQDQPVRVSSPASGWGMVATGLVLALAALLSLGEGRPTWPVVLVTMASATQTGAGVGTVLATRWVRPRPGAWPVHR